MTYIVPAGLGLRALRLYSEWPNNLFRYSPFGGYAGFLHGRISWTIFYRI